MRTQNTKYNGWANYETWNIKLWMDNDEGSYHYWKEVAQELIGRACWSRGRIERQLADQLQEEHESELPNELGGWQSDILRGALSSVDWHEIAKALLEDSSNEGN